MTNNNTARKVTETMRAQTVAENLGNAIVTDLNDHHGLLNIDYPVSGDHLTRIKQAHK